MSGAYIVSCFIGWLHGLRLGATKGFRQRSATIWLHLTRIISSCYAETRLEMSGVETGQSRRRLLQLSSKTGWWLGPGWWWWLWGENSGNPYLFWYSQQDLLMIVCEIWKKESRMELHCFLVWVTRRKRLPLTEKGRAALATKDELRNEWTFSPGMVPSTECVFHNSQILLAVLILPQMVNYFSWPLPYI